MPSGSSQNCFFGQHGPNMDPSCPPRRFQVGAKMPPKSVQKRLRRRNPFQNRFWIDFGTIFGTIFDRFWDDVWLNFDRYLCIILFDFQHGRINKFIQTRAHTCPQITFRIYNESALPVPCIHRFLFLDVFFGVALGRVQDDFGAQHGPNLSPCWSHVDHFLVHFWVFFWHLNLRSLLRRFFVDF